MLPLSLGHDATRPLEILCLGAHCDDIEIGCGGTLLRLLGERPGCTVHWVILSSTPTREREARTSAAAFASAAGELKVEVESFRESYFPFIGSEIKDYFEDLKRRVDPDLVFTHRRDDEHQDHHAVAQFTWNTFRDHLIAEYEIPKYEGDLGHPNLYVSLDAGHATTKIDLIIEHFESQRHRPWFRSETFRGLMALRGVECAAPAGFAEGFHVRKALL